MHPRHIIPGQKVHASILFSNTYKPRATLGEGFDIPVIQAKLADTELDQEIWDTGMFNDTAAKELIAYLGSQQGVAPIYLDRLLFMLRFSELSSPIVLAYYSISPPPRGKGKCSEDLWLARNIHEPHRKSWRSSEARHGCGLL